MWRQLAADRELPELSAASRRNRRQGLHRRPRLAPRSRRWPRRSCAAPSSSRGRSARPPPASTSRAVCGRSCASRLGDEVAAIEMGDVGRLPNFMGASSTTAPSSGSGRHRGGPGHGYEILAGGGTDDSEGWFVRPTVIVGGRPRRTGCCATELFGPVVTVHVYDDGASTRALGSSTKTTPTRSPAGSSPRTARPSGWREPPSLQRRQLLHQRQADRGGGRAAALRRGQGVGDGRQGGLALEPHPLGQPEGDQGDLRPAPGVPPPVPGLRPVRAGGRTPSRWWG